MLDIKVLKSYCIMVLLVIKSAPRDHEWQRTFVNYANLVATKSRASSLNIPIVSSTTLVGVADVRFDLFDLLGTSVGVIPDTIGR